MKTYLLLASGDIFEGESIGAAGESIGEVVFTTGMGGYMETLTDGAYFGQIITQTFPLIGNYGAIEADLESGVPACAGYIVRELCGYGSNFRKEGELSDFLIKRNVVGISGIDTRKLTKLLREHGVMNGMITPSLAGKADKLERIKNFKITGAAKKTAASEVKYHGEGRRVVLIDYGAKANTVAELTRRGCEAVVVPCTMTAEEILDLKPEGLVLSGGGGDPTDCAFELVQLKKLNEKGLPTLGISLGHQLMALASGGKTYKLKYGHRGANQPVKDLESGRVYITAQNHGYAVVTKSLENVAKPRMVNLNDGTCEGVDYTDKPCFTVQFHPGSHGGPQNTEFIFDRFIDMMEGKNA